MVAELGMSVEVMSSMSPGVNPLLYDRFRMATRINDRFVAMYSKTDSNELILVDVKTGKRLKIKSKEMDSDSTCPLCKQQAVIPGSDICEMCNERVYGKM